MWRVWWMWEGVWEILSFIILVVVAYIWRPSPDNPQYHACKQTASFSRIVFGIQREKSDFTLLDGARYSYGELKDELEIALEPLPDGTATVPRTLLFLSPVIPQQLILYFTRSSGRDSKHRNSVRAILLSARFLSAILLPPSISVALVAIILLVNLSRAGRRLPSSLWTTQRWPKRALSSQKLTDRGCSIELYITFSTSRLVSRFLCWQSSGR